jgi:hypothetical protein
MTTRNLTSVRRCRTARKSTQAFASKSDKMSEMLASYAVILDPRLARKEVLLRAELIEGLNSSKRAVSNWDADSITTERCTSLNVSGRG